MIKIALIGFGTVGQGFVEILADKIDYLLQKYNQHLELVAITDIKFGTIIESHGIDLKRLLQHVKNQGDWTEYPAPVYSLNSIQTILKSSADIVVEATPTNLKDGQPALDHIQTALQSGKHVVTCNKGPIALAYTELQKLAESKKLQLRFEGAVMSGTPVLNTALQNLKGCEIHQIRGIFNGTTNYILSEMEQGHSYTSALQAAQKLGYAEADPAGDVEGWDALAKVIILASVLCGESLEVDEVPCSGITELTQQAVQEAVTNGFRWKLIGEIKKTATGIAAKVEPQKIPLSHPLANIMGSTNAITFDTDLLGPVTVVGTGAGKKETAFALLNDIIQIIQ